jgi:hypothetical protein
MLAKHSKSFSLYRLHFSWRRPNAAKLRVDAKAGGSLAAKRLDGLLKLDEIRDVARLNPGRAGSVSSIRQKIARDNNWRAIQLADDGLVVLNDLGQSECCDRGANLTDRMREPRQGVGARISLILVGHLRFVVGQPAQRFSRESPQNQPLALKCAP